MMDLFASVDCTAALDPRFNQQAPRWDLRIGERPVDPHAIVAMLAAHWGVEQRSLTRAKYGSMAKPWRDVAMAVLRDRGVSLTRIAKIFMLDHSTVLYACRAVAARRRVDSMYDEAYCEVLGITRDA